MKFLSLTVVSFSFYIQSASARKKSTSTASPMITATLSGSPPPVSTDGTCSTLFKPEFSCQGSQFGNCCSQYGYCGSSQLYCGTGCQPLFGSCTSSTSSSVVAHSSSVVASSIPASSKVTTKATTAPIASHASATIATTKAIVPTTTLDIISTTTMASASSTASDIAIVPSHSASLAATSTNLPLPSQANITDYQTWTYTDPPACLGTIDILKYKPTTAKMEYLWVQKGVVSILTIDNNGCESYSASAAAQIVSNSKYQYITSSGATIQDFRPLWANAAIQASSIATMVNLVVLAGFTGLEIDWEDYWNWKVADFNGFQSYMAALGTALHAQGKKLMIDVPEGTQFLTLWNWSTFNSLPIDYFVVMSYGYFYDVGAGVASAPSSWLRANAAFLQSNIPNVDRIVIGVPGDCYYGVPGSYATTEAAFSQVAIPSNGYLTINSAIRDPGSLELQWNYQGIFYSCSDSVTLDARATLLSSMGITRVASWFMGGNAWFPNAPQA